MSSNDWDLNKLNERLLEWYCPDHIKNFTILIFVSKNRMQELPLSVIMECDFIIKNGVLIKDRSGRLK